MEKQKILMAKTHEEIDNLVEAAAAARNLELDSSIPYGEQAEFFRQEAAGPVKMDDAAHTEEMADLLDLAETRWFEI